MDKLRKVNAGFVKSAEGWSARVDREALEYREGDEVTVMTIEYDPSSREITVHASEIQHVHKDRIVANVKRAVALLTGKWVIL
jgi:ribosomal protein S1